MSMPVYLVGANGQRVKVNKAGEVQIAQGDYDLTSFNVLDTDDAAFNFYRPEVGRQFLITGVLAFADKDVSDADDTVIVIYEASGPASTTTDRILLQFGMAKLSVLPYPNIRILVNEGVWINAKSGDDDIHMNVVGHFINTVTVGKLV